MSLQGELSSGHSHRFETGPELSAKDNFNEKVHRLNAGKISLLSPLLDGWL